MENLKGGLIELMNRFPDDESCREHLERVRWPNGPTCPFDDCLGGKKIYALNGKSCRKGLHKCGMCRRQFTVTKGTIFEDSKIGLRKWFIVMFLMGSSKKGISAHQIHRMLKVCYETAWFMCHRVREAMRLKTMTLELSGIVEVDETYVGGKAKGKRGRGAGGKTIVFGIAEREGDILAVPVPDASSKTLKGIIKAVVEPGSKIMSDEWTSYKGLSQDYEHQVVNHKKEYVSGKDIHVNSVESFWALLKRGVYGTFHHISRKRMDMYCGEFSRRFNLRKMNDMQRFETTITACDGRLDWYIGRNAKKAA